MKTFNNDPKKKKARIKRAKSHLSDDRLIQGVFSGMARKGCSVGCDMQDVSGAFDIRNVDIHATVAVHDGVPVWLEHLRDCVFEGLSEEDARDWHLKLAKAIPVGVDLDRCCLSLLAWMFDPQGLLKGLVEQAKNRKSFKNQLSTVHALLQSSISGDAESIDQLKAAFDCEKLSDRIPLGPIGHASQINALIAASRACLLAAVWQYGCIEGQMLQHVIRGVCSSATMNGEIGNEEEAFASVADEVIRLFSSISTDS